PASPPQALTRQGPATALGPATVRAREPGSRARAWEWALPTRGQAPATGQQGTRAQALALGLAQPWALWRATRPRARSHAIDGRTTSCSPDDGAAPVTTPPVPMQPVQVLPVRGQASLSAQEVASRQPVQARAPRQARVSRQARDRARRQAPLPAQAPEQRPASRNRPRGGPRTCSGPRDRALPQ